MAVKSITDSNFIEHIKGKNAVIKFYADWCGSCKLFAGKYKRISENEAFAKIDFLEIDSEHNPEARKAIGVDNLPFFALFKDGKLIEKTTTSKEEELVSLIEKI